MLDHGTLNIPLSKRGNIDAQIDRYKAQVAADQKAARKTRAAEQAQLRVTAKALLANLTTERLNELAAGAKSTPAKVKAHLKSEAHWQPEFVIKVLSPAA